MNRWNNEGKKIIFFICLIFVVMVSVTSVTYAYFALSVSNTNTIAGTTATVGLDLKVERIIPSSVGVMVPQLEEYLDNAISTNYSCIDGNGNTVCQVYRAVVTNTSTATVQVDGTIKFSGINNMPNLKWKRITNERTIGEYESKVASTSKVIFEGKKKLEKNESATYYFVIWIDELGRSQKDSGTFRVNIEFNSSYGGGITSTIVSQNEYASSIMIPTAVSDASLDFSQSSVTSNTNGVYLRSGTENDPFPIYYYRGNVNNNLIFADTCWKVVRTTETGGLKLIYNGVPSNGQCNNTGIATTIGTKQFNLNGNSLAYVGYMYSNIYTNGYKENMDKLTDIYYYGNDVIYSNGTYTLIDTVSSDDWKEIYDNEINNHHYTCFNSGTTCTSVYYIYSTSKYSAYYITLVNGKKIEDALVEMLGADDENTENYNTISSTIKGNNTTEGTLDYWYYTNIEQKGYSSYIEDTVWCNDRSIFSLGAFDPNGDINNGLRFSSGNRFSYDSNPTLKCSRIIDSFTVSEVNGNGDLDYPVGLLTVDEVMLAGVSKQLIEHSHYLYGDGDSVDGGYWIGSMSWGSIIDDIPEVGIISVSGNVYATDVNNEIVSDMPLGVRPSISLKNGFTLTGNGNGTATNPYVVG